MKSEQSSTLADWLARARRKATKFWAPAAVFFARKDVKDAWDWIKEPLYAVLLMFGLTSILAQPFYVPSGSMEPSLAIGDAVLAAKFPYGYTRYSLPFDYIFLGESKSPPKPVFASLPKAGDVVVFRLPWDTKVTYVKRVIGLPGDHLQMRNGRLWINDRELPLQYVGTGENEWENGQYVSTAIYIETLPNGRKHRIFKEGMDGTLDNTDVYVVPPGHVFMMGDNRDHSLDSRVPSDGTSPLGRGVGYVPVGNLVGKPFLVIGSVDFKNAAGIWEWPLYFRFSRLFNRVR